MRGWRTVRRDIIDTRKVSNCCAARISSLAPKLVDGKVTLDTDRGATKPFCVLYDQLAIPTDEAVVWMAPDCLDPDRVNVERIFSL